MKRIHYTSLFLMILAMTSSIAFAETCSGTLKSHLNQDGRFEALMPASTTSVTVPGESLLDTQFISEAITDNAKFQVRAQVIVPIDLGDESITTSLRENFVNQAREQQQVAFGRAIRERDIKQNGMLGSEFEYGIPAKSSPTGTDIFIKRRVMFDGKRLFIATVLGSKEIVSSRTGTQFLDSVQPTK